MPPIRPSQTALLVGAYDLGVAGPSRPQQLAQRLGLVPAPPPPCGVLSPVGVPNGTFFAIICGSPPDPGGTTGEYHRGGTRRGQESCTAIHCDFGLTCRRQTPCVNSTWWNIAVSWTLVAGQPPPPPTRGMGALRRQQCPGQNATTPPPAHGSGGRCRAAPPPQTQSGGRLQHMHRQRNQTTDPKKKMYVSVPSHIQRTKEWFNCEIGLLIKKKRNTDTKTKCTKCVSMVKKAKKG